MTRRPLAALWVTVIVAWMALDGGAATAQDCSCNTAQHPFARYEQALHSRGMQTYRSATKPVCCNIVNGGFYETCWRSLGPSSFAHCSHALHATSPTAPAPRMPTADAEISAPMPAATELLPPKE